MQDLNGRSIHYLRLSVTELCNLRCRYCMPAEGVCKKRHEEMLSEDEMIRAVTVAAELGIIKLRITGGDPLVKRNILSICRRAAAVEGIREVCITTNGTLLGNLAVPLREAGVQRVNISLDTLNPEKYARITRVGDLRTALQGIEAALKAGFEKVKLNAVQIGGFNDDEILPLTMLTKQYPIDVRFIELMPMVDNREFDASAYLSWDAVLALLPEAVPVGSAGGVAELYRLPGALGNVGLIRPLSACFCAECSRIRLTADGKLKPCLHSPAEFCIKGLDDAGMRERFIEAIQAKPAWHGELSRESHSMAGRSMNRIGG